MTFQDNLEAIRLRVRICNFSRMYCTVCIFLHSSALGLCTEKQSQGRCCHTLRKPSVGNPKRRPWNPSKGTRKRLQDAFTSTKRRSPKVTIVQCHFLRRNLCGRFAVFEPWTREIGPQIYMDIYIYIYIYMYICIRMYVALDMYIHTSLSIYTYIYIYICICVYTCIKQVPSEQHQL